MGKLEDLYINRMREYLKRQAMQIINNARLSKETGDETFAQYDSYGALIFYNGGLVYSFIADPSKKIGNQHFFIEASNDKENQEKHRGWEKGGIPEGTGTDWAKLLRNEIKGGAWNIPKKGFCLVVFNAAFYSGKQERGAGLKRKYRILSMVASDMKKLESQFKKQGAVLRWHNLNVK